MDITHNEINNAISDMEFIVRKGQPFAKANKDRRIRAVLRLMRKEQGIQHQQQEISGLILKSG